MLDGAKPRTPADFASILATPEPVLIVGGQAVNLWALHYADATRSLAPFTSRDADVLGNRDTLKLLGKVSGTKPQLFPLKPPSNEIGVVIAKDSEGKPLLVEVLKYVKGPSNEELRDPSYQFVLGEKVTVSVPGPIALLKAKVANLAEIAQKGRQDGRHVLILLRLMPAYLSDLTKLAADGGMKERRLVDFLEQLLKVIQSDHGKRAWQSQHIDPNKFFGALDPTGLPKLEAFLSKRLAHAFA